MRKGLCISVLGSLLAMTTPAWALFPERYIACHEPELREAPQSPEAATLEPSPLPRRRAPAPLDPLPMIVGDVTYAEPTPRGHIEIAVQTPLDEPPKARGPSSTDFRCLGIPRGTAGILRVIGAPPGARFSEHPYPYSWIETNVEVAGIMAVDTATPYLRRLLARKAKSDVAEGVDLDRLRVKVAAARALADLQDSASATVVLELVRDRESRTFPGLWDDAVDALERLDPKVAADYAIEAYDRIAATPDHDVAESARTLRLMHLLAHRDARALAALGKVAAEVSETSHEGCLLMGARVLAGDDKLRGELRAELSVDLRTNRAVVCYSEIIRAAFPGDDPDEVPTLILRHRYEEIALLVDKMARAEAAGAQNPKFAKARKDLRDFLEKQRGTPAIAGGHSDNRYSAEDHALFLAISAKLGDTRDAKALSAWIRDADDELVAPWVGARAALDLELPGAADDAAVRLSIARSRLTQRFSTELWPTRGALTITEHGEIIERLFAIGDDRFALGLLDRDVFTRELTASLVARRKSKKTCKVVADAASGAEEDAIQAAFWSLSTLESGCESDFARLFFDKSQPNQVRGMALEALAMLRHEPVKSAVDAPREKGDKLYPQRYRARIIFYDPE
ncbi:MAG: hypothetical protein U0271_19665 [Polyangiaceae bacterium]